MRALKGVRVSMLALVTLVATSTANAGTTIASGGLRFSLTPGNDNKLVCTITNISSQPIMLETEPQIFGAQSDNASQQNTATDCGILAPLAPGSSCSSNTSAAIGGNCSTCYCKVTFSGSKKSVRAMFSIFSFSDGERDVVAVPLQ